MDSLILPPPSKYANKTDTTAFLAENSTFSSEKYFGIRTKYNRYIGCEVTKGQTKLNFKEWITDSSENEKMLKLLIEVDHQIQEVLNDNKLDEI